MRIFLSLLLLSATVSRADTLSLPDPLTLEFATAQASAENHYQIIEAAASLEQVQSRVYHAQSLSEWQAKLELQASVFEPSPLAVDQSTNEFATRLHIEKLLYDFGRSTLLQESADLQHEAVRNYLSHVLDQRRLEITRQFLAVLLADLKFSHDQEAMDIAWVQHDNAKEKHALRQLSDVDLLALENQYQNLRYQRLQSENFQRSTRTQLAEMINCPGELASNLQRPVFSLQRELPDYQHLVDAALAKNARLHLLQAGVAAAQKKMESAQQQTRPSLNAEMDLMDSSVERSSQDDWRASLILTIPLLEQQSVKAQVSAERSQWMLQRAMLLQEQTHVRQRVLWLWQQIQLLNTRLQQIRIAADYNELYLDRSRALYELEVKTDLGDAMVAMSETRYQQAQVEFDLALAWLELDMMTNVTIEKGSRN